jgi:hypothetical protein
MKNIIGILSFSSREEQDALQVKLSAIEKKIIVGGENLLEKAEEQERLLEESAKELEDRQRKEEELKKALEEKEVKISMQGLNNFQRYSLVWQSNPVYCGLAIFVSCGLILNRLCPDTV